MLTEGTVSYHDQALLRLESRYLHAAKDFERLNTLQTQKGVIAKKMLLKYANLPILYPQGCFFEIDGAENPKQ